MSCSIRLCLIGESIGLTFETKKNEGKTEERNEKAYSSSSARTETLTTRKQRSGIGPRQQEKSYKARVCFVISTVSMLTSGFCLIIVSTHEMSSGSIPPSESQNLSWCMTCEYITQGNSSQGSPGQCCVTNSEHLSTILAEALADTQTTEEPLPTFDPANFTLSKASIHRRLLPLPETWYEVNRGPHFYGRNLRLGYLDEMVEAPHIQHERNVKTGSDGATIVVPGLYLVYLSIHFMPDSGYLCQEFKEQAWRCHVVRTSLTDPKIFEILLSGVYTCQYNDYRVHETVYISGTFDLQTNDTIHAEVSGVELLSYQVQSTFMGLILLEEDAPGIEASG